MLEPRLLVNTTPLDTRQRDVKSAGLASSSRSSSGGDAAFVPGFKRQRKHPPPRFANSSPFGAKAMSVAHASPATAPGPSLARSHTTTRSPPDAASQRPSGENAA